MGFLTGHSNHWTFLSSLRSITQELSLKMMHHSSILPTVGYSFYTCVVQGNACKKVFHKDSMSAWGNQDLNPGLADPKDTLRQMKEVIKSKPKSEL